MKVCFIGHKKIEKTEELRFFLKEIVVSLIRKGATTFLFGSKSAFDDLSWEVVSEIKKKYPYIKRIYVRSTYPQIEKFYEEYLLTFYEETYYPTKIKNAGKYSYIERNYEMIDESTYCVFYYNEKYVPPLKGQTKNKMLLPSRRKSGTKIAYEYAIKKEKEIINLYKKLKFFNNTFRKECIEGLTVNAEVCEEEVERSIGIVTALCPQLGYSKAAEIAKRALKEKRNVREILAEENYFDEQSLKKLLNPQKMI